MTFAAILATVLATSILSGILGMAGGMILMAVLVLLLSVPSAMMLHGAVQAMSNGSRAWFLRQHIRWAILPVYLLGAAAAVGLFSWLMLVPDAGVVLILIGIFPWLARTNHRLRGLNILHRPTTFICGFVVTSAQLLAGASGPLLDVFYLNSPMSRLEIVANKAITQTLGHILKIVYYGAIVAVAAHLSPWLVGVAMATAIAGARIGTTLLTRWNDHDFNRVSQLVILSIATICLLRGLWAVLS